MSIYYHIPYRVSESFPSSAEALSTVSKKVDSSAAFLFYIVFSCYFLKHMLKNITMVPAEVSVDLYHGVEA